MWPLSREVCPPLSYGVMAVGGGVEVEIVKRDFFFPALKGWKDYE